MLCWNRRRRRNSADPPNDDRVDEENRPGRVESGLRRCSSWPPLHEGPPPNDVDHHHHDDNQGKKVGDVVEENYGKEEQACSLIPEHHHSAAYPEDELGPPSSQHHHHPPMMHDHRGRATEDDAAGVYDRSRRKEHWPGPDLNTDERPALVGDIKFFSSSWSPETFPSPPPLSSCPKPLQEEHHQQQHHRHHSTPPDLVHTFEDQELPATPEPNNDNDSLSPPEHEDHPPPHRIQTTAPPEDHPVVADPNQDVPDPQTPIMPRKMAGSWSTWVRQTVGSSLGWWALATSSSSSSSPASSTEHKGEHTDEDGNSHPLCLESREQPQTHPTLMNGQDHDNDNTDHYHQKDHKKKEVIGDDDDHDDEDVSSTQDESDVSEDDPPQELDLVRVLWRSSPSPLESAPPSTMRTHLKPSFLVLDEDLILISDYEEDDDDDDDDDDGTQEEDDDYLNHDDADSTSSSLSSHPPQQPRHRAKQLVHRHLLGAALPQYHHHAVTPSTSREEPSLILLSSPNDGEPAQLLGRDQQPAGETTLDRNHMGRAHSSSSTMDLPLIPFFSMVSEVMGALDTTEDTSTVVEAATLSFSCHGLTSPAGTSQHESFHLWEDHHDDDDDNEEDEEEPVDEEVLDTSQEDELAVEWSAREGSAAGGRVEASRSGVPTTIFVPRYDPMADEKSARGQMETTRGDVKLVRRAAEEVEIPDPVDALIQGSIDDQMYPELALAASELDRLLTLHLLHHADVLGGDQRKNVGKKSDRLTEERDDTNCGREGTEGGDNEWIVPALLEVIQKHPEACQVFYHPPGAEDWGAACLPLQFFCATSCLPAIQAATAAYPEALGQGDSWLGNTPLHYACHHQADVSVIQFLVEHFPDACRMTNHRYETPLHVACRASPTRVGNAEVTTDHHHQLHSWRRQVVDLLLPLYPTAAHLADHDGYTPLHLACQQAQPLRPSSCLGGKVDSRDSSVMKGEPDLSDLLSVLQALASTSPISLRATTRRLQKPLHVAASFGAAPCVLNWLLTRDSSQACVTDESFQTPLHKACLCPNTTWLTVRMIMAACPEAVEWTDEHEKRPYDYAVETKLSDPRLLQALKYSSS